MTKNQVEIKTIKSLAVCGIEYSEKSTMPEIVEKIHERYWNDMSIKREDKFSEVRIKFQEDLSINNETELIFEFHDKLLTRVERIITRVEDDILYESKDRDDIICS